MDAHVDDKLYHQVEKSLSNNLMSEDLFSSGRERINEKTPSTIERKEEEKVQEKPNLQPAEGTEQVPVLSRAEYIKQAREACMRQLDTVQKDVHNFDAFHGELFGDAQETSDKNRSRNKGLFFEEDSKETAEYDPAFRSLVIRTICAIAIFLCIFLFDKIKIEIGNFSHEVIREYVTGVDYLEDLESIMVSLIK